jgi:hypothetical protein
MAAAWFRRNAVQRSTEPAGAGRFGMYRCTVRSATWKPSMRSSPWIRGAPHVGFSNAMRLTRSRTSDAIGGRPGFPRVRDFQRQ